MARAHLVLPLGLLLAACGSDPQPETFVFPEGFLFGTAVAGFQADMGCPTLSPEVCDDPGSDWYAFVTSPEVIADPGAYLAGDPPSAGPGQWELYEADLERAATELHSTGFRFSIEWSRVFPTATDGIDGVEALRAVASAEAIAHYHAVLQAARARGVTPLVTLNHYSLPTWIHDGVGCHFDLDTCSPRGWLDRERTVAEIAKFSGFVAAEFGGEVDLWATLNEPLAIVLPGYLMPSADRSNPPAVTQRFAEARQVFVALVEAHARMYDAVHAADLADADGDGTAAEVGLVYALAPVAPMDEIYESDRQAAENVFYLWNTAFLDAVALGDLDEDLDGVPAHRDDLADRMDYLGINYYTRVTVAGVDNPVFPEFSPLTTFNPATMIPWETYPKGLYEMAVLVKDRYGLPAIITENGAQDPDDDGTGPDFLVDHLMWAARAIRDGVDLRGYFYWTLIDNYEWNHGMDIRMGLYAVDEDDPTKARVARQAVPVFGRIAAAGEVAKDLVDQYGASEMP